MATRRFPLRLPSFLLSFLPSLRWFLVGSSSRMPLKVVVELQVHAVSCPGVYLTEKSDVYLHVCILGQCKETDCLPPIFPLLFHEKMWFEKIFEKATDPVDVVELLEKNVTKIRLSELIPSEKEELAYYEKNTRDFLFPEPKLTPPFPGVDRELLMKTYLSFPGIAPKLEFSTRTTITELPLLPRKWYRERNKARLRRAASASPRRRSISPAQCKTPKNKICKRYTRTSRSRSPSPRPGKRLQEHYKECQCQLSPPSSRSVKFKAEADHRPPFVVRHVDTSKTFAEKALPQVPLRNVRQNVSPSRHSPKLQLKRALSFDSWKSTCPAAKVIREPEEQYRSDPALSSFPETTGPVTYPRSIPAISRKTSSDSLKRYRSPSPRGRWAQHRTRCSPSSSWEEINERVKNLLTSNNARQRLSMGVTDMEIDEVLERRSISLRSSPQCDSTGKRYYS